MNFPTEPSADIRETASALWQMFVALQSQGFNEAQALTIVSKVWLGATGGGA